MNVLAALTDAPRLTFPDLLRLLHESRYTGPLTLHFAEGIPQIVAVVPDPVTRHLDKPGHRRADCTTGTGHPASLTSGGR